MCKGDKKTTEKCFHIQIITPLMMRGDFTEVIEKHNLWWIYVAFTEAEILREVTRQTQSPE